MSVCPTLKKKSKNKEGKQEGINREKEGKQEKKEKENEIRIRKRRIRKIGKTL